MINSIKFKPTTFYIADNARRVLSKYNDNEIIPLALEAIENTIKSGTVQNRSFKERFYNLFKTKSQLNVVLGKEEQGGFFIRAIRRIGFNFFEGNKIPVDFESVVKSKNYVENLIVKSKEGILSEIKKYKFDRELF